MKAPGAGARLWLNREVELDLAARCLRRQGEPIPLRAKIFDLLVYLVEHRDRVVTKDELLSEIWQDTPVTLDALVQSILELRRRLGDSGRNPRFIQTISKTGYRLIAEVAETAPETETPSASEPPPPRRSRWLFAAAAAALAAIVSVPLLSERFHRKAVEPEWWELAWWRLDEGTGSKIVDSVHGLNASLPPGVGWAAGVSGSGLVFAGRELPVRGRDPGILPRGAAPRTLTAWVNPGRDRPDATAVFSYGDPSSDTEFDQTALTVDETGVAIFAIRHEFVRGRRRLDDGGWHQLTGVFEGEATRQMRLFVDGTEEASQPHDAYPLKAGRESVWTLGGSALGSTTYRGGIDDVRIYERALRPDEIRSLYRCAAGVGDIDVEDGGSYFFAPVFGNSIEVLPRRPGETSAAVRNTGKDFAGVMLARREPGCGLRSLHGAAMPQDLNLAVDLLAPPGDRGAIVDAGPYFRSRRANPGDGIMGGSSAGFWVDLDSTGRVRVWRLNPSAVLAFSDPPAGFDNTVFHHLEIAARGETLQAALDGRVLTFDVGGQQRQSVEIRPLWETLTSKGSNRGSAGLAFGSTHNREQAGGQEARNFRVKPYHALIAPAN